MIGLLKPSFLSASANKLICFLMSKNKKLIAISIVLFSMFELVISGCQKNTTAVIPLVPETVTKTVSFSKDLVPVLTDNCALSGCHVKGANAPDLTAGSAYNSLTNGSYIDKSSRKIVLFISG